MRFSDRFEALQGLFPENALHSPFLSYRYLVEQLESGETSVPALISRIADELDSIDASFQVGFDFSSTICTCRILKIDVCVVKCLGKGYCRRQALPEEGEEAAPFRRPIPRQEPHDRKQPTRRVVAMCLCAIECNGPPENDQGWCPRGLARQRQLTKQVRTPAEA